MADCLRIVSYNVRYFGHALRGLASTLGPKRRVAAAITALDPLPDILCLQEVETQSFRSSVAHRPSRPDETQLEAFMDRMAETFALLQRPMPYEAFYFRAHRYGVRDFSLYTTGLAILVNTQRLAVDTHNVDAPHPITHHHVQMLRERKQSRICAHMRLVRREDGLPLHVFNTHLSLPTPFTRAFWATRDKMGNGINQLHEARALAEVITQKTKGEPFVVCGDFNSPPASPVYRFFCDEAHYTAAQAAVGQVNPLQSRGFSTAGFMHLRMHLDHIFSGARVRWLDTEGTLAFGDPRSRFHGLSDHMPLIARFQLDPPAVVAEACLPTSV
ncbi:MAG: endonuclease/exonuclease/phosphatase family protein [Cystobacter sp.]